MRLRPSDWLQGAAAGGAGAIWGLGLARLVAEAGFWPTLYSSPVAAAGVAIICGGVALALWPNRPRSPTSAPPRVGLLPLTFPALYVTDVVSHPLAGGVLLAGGALLSLLVVWGDRARWTPPAALGLAVFGLYLRTLLPSLGQADTFEFQVVVPRLAVAHPTGYPLYILLGKLFTLLPLGDVAWRVNLASAVFAAAAVLVLYVLLLHLTSRYLPAFLAALAFACSSTFWSQAIVAEVYALHILLVAAALWLLLPASGEVVGGAARRWQAAALLIGLSLANHLTTALLLPAVALALLWDRPRLRPKEWLVAGALLILGLSVYLFIPLRWPALNRGEWMTLREFVSYVTGGQFHGALQSDGWRDPTRWAIVGRLFREPFGWVGLGLAAAGVVSLATRQRRSLALTGVTFLAFVLYGLDYHVPDIAVFLLPAHLILAIWAGAGIVLLADLASQLLSSFAGRRLLVVLCALLPLSRVWMNLPQVDQSHNRGAYAWGQHVLSLPIAPDAAILADSEKFPSLYYLQQVEGLRPDLDLVMRFYEAEYREELMARLGAGQTVYMARFLPHLEIYFLRSLGPLVEVGTAPTKEPPAGTMPVGAVFGDKVALLAFDLRVEQDVILPVGQDDTLSYVTLYWQAVAELQDDLEVRLRLTDQAGQVAWASDGARPVGGWYPTNAWPSGTVVPDCHRMPLPAWLPPGEYRLEVGLFPRFGDTGLEVEGKATSWLTLDRLELGPPAAPLPPLPSERRYAFSGGAWLTGFDLAPEAYAGAPFTVDLSWHGAEVDEEVRLAWVDVQGQDVEVVAFPLGAGAVRSRHLVTAPGHPGRYALHVGLVGETARCDWLAAEAGQCPLAEVEVVPTPEGLANFADLAILLDAELGLAEARPGQALPVTLRWRALRTMDEDYTAFVQLIGPDGRLHGQVDTWPVQGTRPTSGWTPGEELNDPYEVRLDSDAPSGRYQVLVGWYLLATMERLQIVDASGRPIGDSFVVGELTVDF